MPALAAEFSIWGEGRLRLDQAHWRRLVARLRLALPADFPWPEGELAIHASLDFRSADPHGENLRLVLTATGAPAWPEFNGFALTGPVRLSLALALGSTADAEPLIAAPMSPLCAFPIATRLRSPADLVHEPLLRSYRPDEWALWFAAVGLAAPVLRGPVFDSSALMATAAAAGQGVALAPAAMFTRELAAGQLVQPFAVEIDAGRYWLTRLMSRAESDAMRRFKAWLLGEMTAA